LSAAEKILFVLAIEFFALGGLAFGAAALGLGKWPRRRVLVLAVGGVLGLGLSLGSAYTYANISDTGSAATARVPGPTHDQVTAAQSMSPDQRRAMINAMVARLAGRLRDNPKDLEGWLRLARAYAVLGQKAQALEAYGAAKRHFPDSAKRIDALINDMPQGG
jgi:cytochrome c-type biogenesis protein CcmH/NrfG